MRWRLFDRARGVLSALIGAALGAMAIPGAVFGVVILGAVPHRTTAYPLAEAAFHIAILVGFVGLVAVSFAFGFALFMATAMHEALRRLRARSIIGFVLAGIFLYGFASFVMVAAGTSFAYLFVFYPITAPSVLLGSLLFARQMRVLDARAGDPWP